MRPPEYFHRIQRNASQRWDQLEQDPELAGPWRQLFNQVQSPRHVVSELLQNADDAGATDASVEISNGEFIFSHNGEDFNEEQFASLCRFGFSNKRTLHTIGFRGVGFKSTFSLGDEVHLVTPTLSVAFRKQRFTEPVWTEAPGTPDGRTEVRVAIQKVGVQQELAKNLQDWGDSPTSLLFFNNIRCLRLGEREIRWESQGTGPVQGSEWMSASTSRGDRYLIIRSPEEAFPDDALNEIKDERMTPDDSIVFPPCRVEIVLGMEGRLFVVLPTGVTTQLPFACNAPFIQDPARLKIKDPALSPTNEWLLKRAGELAADAMLAWVASECLPTEERCQGYGLLPDVDRQVSSIEGSCSAIVKESFEARIEGREFLLTETSTLESPGKCLAVPSELLGVWSPSQVSAGFSLDNQPILSRHVIERDKEKLINWDHVKQLSGSEAIEVLRRKRMPRPNSWWQLLRLWSFALGPMNALPSDNRSFRIVPVRGKDVLYAASEVVRPGERRTLETGDWEFLAPFLLTIDPSWTRQLQQWRNDGTSKDQLRSALEVLRMFGLAEATGINQIFGKAADAFFSQRNRPNIRDCVRLAHIAAKLYATVPNSFSYVSQEHKLRKANSDVMLVDIDGSLDQFVGKGWYKQHVLHDEYMRHTDTCTNAEWRQWVRSDGSGLHTFAPLRKTSTRFYSRKSITSELGRRGFSGEPHFRYKRGDFEIEDWDFESTTWDHWNSLAENDAHFWARLMTHILEQPQSYWSEAVSVRAMQWWGTTHRHSVTQEPLWPEWIIRFQRLPCLLDTWGQPRQPAEVFRRTSETEPLRDVEPFVKADLDTEATRPLLKLLGVCDKPTGPERILERLKALAGNTQLLLRDVQKWCLSLDQLVDQCSTSEIHELKAAFADYNLILTDKEEWAKVDEVFLDSDVDGLPGAEIVHSSLRNLSLWRKIGVVDRPNADLEIEWLKGLPSGRKPSTSQLRRVRRLMAAYPGRIWSETGHWLNLEGVWTPVESLSYSITEQSVSPWSHLFPGIKERAADFRPLSSETCQSHPFSTLPTLSEVTEERFQGQSGLPNPQVKPWLVTLGAGLQRIVMDEPDQTERIRMLAQRLSQTKWQVAKGLKSEPYIEGTPAGTPRPLDVLWRADLLYVQEGSAAKMARLVPQEIASSFNSQPVTEAIKLCYERSPDFVLEYLEDNFELEPPKAEDKPDSFSSQVVQPETREVPDDEVIKPLESGIQGAVSPRKSTPQMEEDSGDDERAVIRQPTTVRSPQRSPIERLAESAGFKTKGTGKLIHPDGWILERNSGNPFPWEFKSAQGDVLRSYWTKEHCIQKEPLELDSDLWELCKQSPASYGLVLTNMSGTPVQFLGSHLVELLEQHRLVLYPAKYRLKYTGDDSQ